MPSFDLYEYVGYIVPGSVLLICLMALCPWITRKQTGGETSAANIGTFLIVAFLLGHFLHVVPHSVEKKFGLSCEGGLYGQNEIVTDPANQGLLSASELEDLRTKVSGQFKVNMRGLTLNKSQDFIAWCNVLLRIQDTVRHEKRGALLDTFIKDYGLYLGLTTAFGLTILLCIVLIVARVPRRQIVSVPITQILIVGVISAIGGSLALIRLLYFGRLFTRELLLSFLAVPNLCCSAFE
jgi:hypothetical protein